jgi:type I restriction enzyme, S subunit
MKLQEVLSLDKDSLIDIKDNVEYSIAGVQSYGKGIVIRRKVFGKELNMKRYKVIKENQLMWCKVDTKNGAFGITKKEHIGSLASTNMSLANIDLKKASPEFIQLFFSMKPFYKHINSLSTGTTNRKYLTPDQVLDLIEIPSMSRSEQDRFMKKLTLFKNKTEEFDIIHNKNESYISKLRKQILQEAVQGKLIKQDPKDEPASALLKKIKSEKEKLIKDKKIKKAKELPPIEEDEVPYELPKGWEWCRLGEISNIFNGNSINKEVKERKYTSLKEGYPFIATKDVEFNSKINYNSGVRIPFNESNFKTAKPQSIFICSEGGSAGRKIAITNEIVCFGNKLFAIEKFKEVNHKYLFYVIKSEYFLDIFKSKMTGIIGGVSIEKFKSIIIPLPSPSEQKRIVEKVDKLMTYYDQLEKQIKENQKNRENLMVAVLKESFQNG